MNASSFPSRGISAALLAGFLMVVVLAGCSREEPVAPAAPAPKTSTAPASPAPTAATPATSAPTSATPIATRPEGSATTPGTPDGAAATLPANQATSDRPTASVPAADTKGTDRAGALTKQEEKSGMPETLHGNNHSSPDSPALAPETKKQ